MISSVAYAGTATRLVAGRADVSRLWRPAAAAAAAMSAARLATAGHVADIPQHKHIANNFASVNRGIT